MSGPVWSLTWQRTQTNLIEHQVHPLFSRFSQLFKEVWEDTVEVDTFTNTNSFERELLPLVDLTLQGLQAGLHIEVSDDESNGRIHEGGDPHDADDAGHDGALLQDHKQELLTSLF